MFLTWSKVVIIAILAVVILALGAVTLLSLDRLATLQARASDLQDTVQKISNSASVMSQKKNKQENQFAQQ